METASFMTPYPNISEKSFGCSSYFTMVSAAIGSDEHSKADIRRISLTVNFSELQLHIPVS